MERIKGICEPLKSTGKLNVDFERIHSIETYECAASWGLLRVMFTLFGFEPNDYSVVWFMLAMVEICFRAYSTTDTIGYAW